MTIIEMIVMKRFACDIEAFRLKSTNLVPIPNSRCNVKQGRLQS